ncbi:hypothetical protein J6590_080254 [Homalodisca vitripennis]|nr:hypothetical protein J6590_080254 [Homalodisca vitripennis]
MCHPKRKSQRTHGQSREKLTNTRLANFSLVAAFGRDHHIKGGVAIYSRTNLTNEISNLELENHSIPLICEIAAIKLCLTNSRGLCILEVYRPPTNCLDKTRQALDLLAYLLETVLSTNSQTLIVGDKNIDDLRSSTENNLLHELLASFNMRPIFLPAIRVTPTSATSIDTGISDHSGQLCSLYVPTSVNNPIISTYRNTKLTNLILLKRLLAEESWEDVMSTNDVNEAHYNLLRLSP